MYLCSALPGALSTMPAVKTFALYAALAVLMDFILQMTAFVALLSLDARRQDNNSCELLCCVKVSTQRPNKPNEGLLLPFMRKYYAPVLLHRYTRIIVVTIFFRINTKLFDHMCTLALNTLNCVFLSDVSFHLHAVWIPIPHV